MTKHTFSQSASYATKQGAAGMAASTPTTTAYGDLDQAYDFFNERLFSGALPPCLITLQRKGRSHGYFAGKRIGTRDGVEVHDEIALNPTHFRKSTNEDILSTLVHEMAHLWQHHLGTPSRSGYHNKQWAAKMREVGLIPSHTGEPGGKETGQQMNHYIAPGGPFDTACAELVGTGFIVRYVDLWDDPAGKKKAESKTKFTCPVCHINAWGKPDLAILCEIDMVRMRPDGSLGAGDGAGPEPEPAPAPAPNGPLSLEPPTIDLKAEPVAVELDPAPDLPAVAERVERAMAAWRLAKGGDGPQLRMPWTDHEAWLHLLGQLTNSTNPPWCGAVSLWLQNAGAEYVYGTIHTYRLPEGGLPACPARDALLRAAASAGYSIEGAPAPELEPAEPVPDEDEDEEEQEAEWAECWADDIRSIVKRSPSYDTASRWAKEAKLEPRQVFLFLTGTSHDALDLWSGDLARLHDVIEKHQARRSSKKAKPAPAARQDQAA